MTLQLIVFIVLALFIAVCSVLAVTTSRILRAATYLLLVQQVFTSSSTTHSWELYNY